MTRTELLTNYRVALAEHDGSHSELLKALISEHVECVRSADMAWPSQPIELEGRCCYSCLQAKLRHIRKHETAQWPNVDFDEMFIEQDCCTPETDHDEFCEYCGVELNVTPLGVHDMMTDSEFIGNALRDYTDCWTVHLALDSGYFDREPMLVWPKTQRDIDNWHDDCEKLRRLVLRTFREKMLGIGVLWASPGKLRKALFALSSQMAHTAWSKRLLPPPPSAENSLYYAHRAIKEQHHAATHPR